MSKPVTIIVPSYCPDDTVREYERRCLECVEKHTPIEMYDLILMGGGFWSYPQKVNAAMSRIDTEFAVVLSNDVFVPDGWLPTMIEDFRNAELIANCAVLAPADKVETDRQFWEEHWWALVMMRPGFYRAMSGLDESLRYTLHDQDYSIRLYQKGCKTLRTASVVVEHVNMATRSRIKVDDSWEWQEMIRRYGVAELKDYIEKHGASHSISQ